MNTSVIPLDTSSRSADVVCARGLSLTFDTSDGAVNALADTPLNVLQSYLFFATLMLLGLTLVLAGRHDRATLVWGGADAGDRRDRAPHAGDSAAGAPGLTTTTVALPRAAAAETPAPPPADHRRTPAALRATIRSGETGASPPDVNRPAGCDAKPAHLSSASPPPDPARTAQPPPESHQ